MLCSFSPCIFFFLIFIFNTLRRRGGFSHKNDYDKTHHLSFKEKVPKQISQDITAGMKGKAFRPFFPLSAIKLCEKVVTVVSNPSMGKQQCSFDGTYIGKHCLNRMQDSCSFPEFPSLFGSCIILDK